MLYQKLHPPPVAGGTWQFTVMVNSGGQNAEKAQWEFITWSSLEQLQLDVSWGCRLEWVCKIHLCAASLLGQAPWHWLWLGVSAHLQRGPSRGLLQVPHGLTAACPSVSNLEDQSRATVGSLLSLLLPYSVGYTEAETTLIRYGICKGVNQQGPP